MRILTKRVLCIQISSCFVCLFAGTARGASALDQGASSFFQNGDRSFLIHSVLGPVCSVIRGIRSEPACNPALLGEDDSAHTGSNRKFFGSNFFIGDDYETLYKNRDLISSDDKRQLAQNLLSETDPIRFESSILLWYRASTWALSYQPLRWTYFSDVQNQSYPDISVHGMQEQSLQGQMGGFLNSNWRGGLQVRYLERRFVHEEFNLFQAVPQFENRLQVRQQKALYLEPAIAYEFDQSEEFRNWRPLLTLQASQVGFVDRSYDDIPTKPVFDTGTSVSPPVAWGHWEIGLNYRWTSHVSTQRKFRVGTLYRWGIMGFSGGYDPEEWSLGMTSTFRFFSVGLMAKRSKLDSDSVSGKSYEDSRFLEFRLVM